MQGPILATMFFLLAPIFSIAETVCSMTPLSAPLQPACAAPITPCVTSPNKIGAQSAVKIPRISPGVRVTIASAFGGFFVFRTASVMIMLLALCTCRSVTKFSWDNVRLSHARRRFSVTASRLSSEPVPQFNEAYMPLLTPPLRVKNACCRLG